MTKYLVSICRTSYAFTSIEVEAESQAEAEATALDWSGDLYFNEREADYEVVGSSVLLS